MRRVLRIALIFLPVILLGTMARAALTNLNIRLVGTNKPSANPLSYGDVWAENDVACMGVWLNYSSYNYGVGIFSITNPAAPALLSVYSPSPVSQNQFELGAIRNRIGYFGSWSGGGLHIVSLTNPAAPQLLCRVGATTGNVTNGFDRVHTIWLERNYLYEAAHVPGIVSVKVFNVSNPSLPVYLQDIVTTNTTKVHQITVRNKGAATILYTSGWGGNDDANPNSPGQTDLWDVTSVGTQAAQWLGRVYSGYNSHSSYPTPDGNTLVVCREIPGGDVKLYDISNPAALTSNTAPVLTLTPASMGLEPDIPHNPVVVSNYLFVSWYQNGLQLFDITDRTKPLRLGFYDTYPAAESSSYQGNWGIFPYLGFDKLLVSDIQSGLFVMDATAALTPTNNYPPLLVTQPASLTVTQGQSATFSSIVTGSSPSFHWRFNGASIAGGTASTLTLTNVQSGSAGLYSLVVSNVSAVITSSVASLSVSVPQAFQTVFYESFDFSDASNNWNLFYGSGNGTPDYTVDWSYDYSSYFSTYNGYHIPSAPNSTNGTTRGLRLTVNNNDSTAATAAVCLYLKNHNFTNAYRVSADMWLNYPGGVTGSGSTGSTEFATLGVNHAGTRVNWDNSTANPSDGIWFAVDGEGGTTQDYRAYAGNPSGSPTLLSFANSGLGASGAASGDSADSVWRSIFPPPQFESAGTPGKQWVQVEITQDANSLLTWKMNGQLIAQRQNTSAFTNGTIMLGYMDVFSSIANPAVDAFLLFDNVRVDLVLPVVPPGINSQPQPVAVFQGQDSMFTVSATGTAPLSYQWLFEGSSIPGATNNSFIVTNTQPTDVGNYSVVIANGAGSVSSVVAALTLRDSPYVSGVTATPGQHAALISWKTTVPGDSRVQYDVASGALNSGQGAFGLSSFRDPVATTNHVVMLTGLSPDTLYSFQVLSSAGTNTYLSGVYQFRTAGTLIIDNPNAILTGAWTTNPASADNYATDYLSSATTSGAPTATATFRPIVTTPGKYNVYVWYSQGPDRASAAPLTVSYNGGSVTVPVNQQNGGGAWKLLASGLDFTRGTNGYVLLANDAGSGIVIADAIRLSYVDGQDESTNSLPPAWWQNFYFGVVTNANLDPDGDGYTTAQEYVTGTNPTNNLSHLSVAAARAGNTVQVKFWPWLSDRNFQLQYSSAPGIPGWQLVPVAPVNDSDGNGTFVISPANSLAGFYQLQVAPGTGAAQPVANRALKSAILGNPFAPYASDPICGPNRVYLR